MKIKNWAWRDIFSATVLSLAAGFASYKCAQFIDPIVFEERIYDIWFDGDLPRVYRYMTSTESFTDSTRSRHPLFPLIAFSPAYLLRKGFGIEPVTSARIVIAAVALLWTIALYAVVRLTIFRHLDAVLFTLVGMSSAGALFWLVVPETFSFGSLTILLPLVLIAIAERYRLSSAWYVLASVLSLSITVTNWMAGLLATLVNHSWRRSLRITIYAFCIVTVLWGIERFLFPSAIYLIGDSYVEPIPNPESGGPLHVLKSFVLHSMIMPAIQVTSWANNQNLPVMTIQRSLPGSASLWGTFAVIAWIALLGLGLWALFSITQHFKFRLVLGLLLVAQLSLHILFGRETFLYSLHFVPLLVIVTALTTLTNARVFGLMLALCLIVFAAVNNATEFARAASFVQREVTQEAYIVRKAMRNRPTDPWPRGAGHIVLGAPGSRDIDKAYLEPGGSFSPTVGSFGVSIWVTDTTGTVKTTSDNVPIDSFRQQLVWSDTDRITPAILTDSTYYRALWSAGKPGYWVLSLSPPRNATIIPTIAIRSVGPAGGPIHSLEWDGQQLVINNRWKVTADPKPASVHIGEEGQKGWMMARSGLARWEGRHGWGYARFEFARGKDIQLIIADPNHPPTANMILPGSRSPLAIEFQDERFAASLHAQVAHLQMGLVGHETRPGDPIGYPFPWLRDEAYIIVALARAGQLTVAKDLSRHLAENDFFGGFGAEADAPGLAIWALVDVAMQLREPEYDQWLWPHVRRKAELILNMLSTKDLMHIPVKTALLPVYKSKPDVTLVAEPSRDGLIVGRIQHTRPVHYVNAVSYRGLLDAATLAERLGHLSEARAWRARAAGLKQAWSKAFATIPYSDKWTSNLWPTGIADQSSTTFLKGLQARWLESTVATDSSLQASKRTHFDVAEAHQWLLLGREDRAWSMLTWFWNDQASPGLYTWSEISKENISRDWERIRGWVKAPHSTPHYRTAAEILLLQLDMLAYADETTSEPTLVIGAGIQPAWLDRSIRVRGLSTRLGQVDWAWDSRQMNVKIRGSRSQVRLGPAFKPNTSLRVEYLDP